MTQSICSHEFDNGMVLVAESMPSLESVAFSFAVPAGCVFDPQDRQGLSAFTCEMALRGAGSRDNRRFIQDLENLGVERNESVSVAHTSYGGATLANNLGPALEIYADLLLQAHLPSEQIEAGRMVVIQELQSLEDEPSQKAMVELRQRQYADPWGRSSRGTRDALEAIRIGDIRKQYERVYRPNGTILGVAGRFEWEALKDHIGQLFGEWKPVHVDVPADGVPRDKNAHLLHDSNQTHVGIAYDSIPYRHPDYFQASGAVGVLSGGMSARLFTEVRERRGLCYTVYASHHTLRDRGSVLCYAGTTSERAQETLDVMLQELIRLGRGVRDEELARLKARVKSGLIMQQESSSARSGAIASDWYHLGRARTLEEIGRLVDGLSCDSINRYLSEHPPEDFAIVTVGPAALDTEHGSRTPT